jgi:hypothetical protein
MGRIQRPRKVEKRNAPERPSRETPANGTYLPRFFIQLKLEIPFADR